MYIAHADHFAQWREQARELLKRGVEPGQISWECNNQSSFAFNDTGDFMSLPIRHQRLSIPKGFMQLAEKVACYRCTSRWALLYSLAWRILFEDRYILAMAIDSQVSQAFQMRKAVGRDKHKMEAFVRFRRLDSEALNTTDVITNADEYYVAWFEPEHLILPMCAPFFVKRFANMSWSILTPDGCAHWDQHSLTFSEGVVKRPDVNDSTEGLWLTYYRHIFNPARLKLKMMQSEMPKKYWVNLPEAPLIKELTRSAGHRVDQMLENNPSRPWVKTQKSQLIKNTQARLRQHKQIAKT